MSQNTPEAQLCVEPQSLKHALAQFATGVAIVTTCDAQGQYVGLTVNSFNAVSLTPPLVLWSIDKHSRTLQAFEHVSHFAVHILAHHQQDLAMRFASRVEDRFADLALDIGLGGVPLISGSLATPQCRTHQRVAAGDHIIMIGWVEALSEADGEQAALGYHRSQFVPVG